jgi:MFS family permease
VTTAIILLLAIRVINGLGFGVHSTTAGAVVADVIPKSRMSEGIGYFCMYATLSTAIGPFIALKIVGDGELHSYRTLFFVASGLCLMSLAADSLITYERKARLESETRAIAEPAAETDRGAEEADGPAGPLPRTFLGFEYAVFLPVVVLILLNFASSSLNTFLTLFAQERTLGNIGVFFTINAAGLFISRLLFGRLADRRGPDIVVIPGIVGLALCYGIIPFIHTPVWLFVLGFPFGLAGGAILPSINALIFRRARRSGAGRLSGLFRGADIGFAIGGTAFGFVAERLGYSYIYWAAAGLALLAVLVYASRCRKHTAEGGKKSGERIVKNKTDKLWTWDFVVVMVACSGISFCNYFFSSTLPIYAKNMTGTSVYAGLIMTVYTLSALASRPLTGYLNNRIGRVRMLVIGAALCAVACFLYQFSSAIALLIAFRIMHGVGSASTRHRVRRCADVIRDRECPRGLGYTGYTERLRRRSRRESPSALLATETTTVNLHRFSFLLSSFLSYACSLTA